MIAAKPEAECRVCGKAFLRFNTTQAVCGLGCARRVGPLQRKAQAEERRQLRGRLEALKSRSKWLAEAQAAFNAFVRLRDAHLPCISCQRFHEGSWDAGHYLTTGARPELRFDERNVHRQCVPCNRHLHGNLVLYRLGLIARIGTDAVAVLEGPHAAAKYSVDQLREIRDTYRARARQLKAMQENDMTVSGQVSAEVSKA